jgi:dTDP-4-amino-4,6-dideoxygalactose transaminase
MDKYSWVDIGSSYLPSDLLAAFLYAQLESREDIQSRRRRIWEYYYNHLHPWAGERDVQLPFIPPQCDQAYHMFYLLLPSDSVRQDLIAFLKARGILSVFHYLPLHLSDMGVRFGGRPGQCPVTESISDRLLRLPFYNDLAEPDQAEVVQAILSFPFPVASSLSASLPD